MENGIFAFPPPPLKFALGVISIEVPSSIPTTINSDGCELK